MKNSINIGWLYPELMSTYGDRGNIFVLQIRSELRNINTKIIPIDKSTSVNDLEEIDLFFGGGAQDIEQEIVIKDLNSKKGEKILEMIEKNTPALFVCGSPQLFGKSYEIKNNIKIQGLGLFDMTTVNPGRKEKRLTGNVLAKINTHCITYPTKKLVADNNVVGFENHGGRTYLGEKARPFAHIIKGYGNNGKDLTEGVVYKNAIGTYLHGPILPKNPILADYLLSTTLKIKYEEEITLSELDDSIESLARESIVKKIQKGI